MAKINLDHMLPKGIVLELDKYIIGQDDAKKMMALVIRNRVRRAKLDTELQNEVSPKNIMMIGSTGVGKTEIARRLSKLSGAPFLKVEATKYTEVGYVGRDVESMIRDLMALTISMVKTEEEEKIREEIEVKVEERLLDALLPESRETNQTDGSSEIIATIDPSTREKFRKMLREGKLEDSPVDLEVQQNKAPKIEVLSGRQMEDLETQLGGLMNMFGQEKKRRRVTVEKGRNLIQSELLERSIDQETVMENAKNRVENMGIIFIDEFDKIAHSADSHKSQDISREGVQRDILPIIEGSKVNTKFGVIDTTHILFIAAGAFSMSKPSDLIPELQGRFPLRVELEDLKVEDYKNILQVPQHSLVEQYIALMATEEIDLTFTDDGVMHIAELAYEVNSLDENIGARRLHTLLELVVREISYDVEKFAGTKVVIDREYVADKLSDIRENRDMLRYIL